MKKVLFFTILLNSFFAISQVTDLNGRTYKVTSIGNQTWMAENLDVDRFQNGDVIPQAKTAEEWNKATKKGKPAWCYCDNNPINGEKYGKLYNWYAVNDPRGLAPKGYHIPSSIEWNKLIETLGGAESCVLQIRSTEGWVDSAWDLRPDKKPHNYNGNNKSKFTALPAGYRNNNGVHIRPGTNDAYWWTSTEDTPNSAWFVTFSFLQRSYTDGSIEYFQELNVNRSYQLNKDMGYSVRCVKN
jgi:uncharacterized protein (TIGR02145 family)